MRVAVTGINGQVVQSLAEAAPRLDHVVVPLGRPNFDLTRPDGIHAALAAVRADVIVSAAAYTAVDRAEDEQESAFAVNAAGAGAVALAAARLDLPIVHLSTDFVFDGSKPTPYAESDPTNPISVYGASKLAGEAAIGVACPNSAVLRTAWVFSPFGANFVKTMLRLAAERDEVAVVADQVGNPTSALSIADGVLRVCERLVADPAGDLRGVFHMTAEGSTSWAGLAEAIFAASRRHGGPSAGVRHIETAAYPTRARRPSNSRLDCAKLAATYDIRLGAWMPEIDRVVARCVAQSAAKDGLVA